MNRLFAILLLLVPAFVVDDARSVTLELKSGHVQYEVVVRTLGISGSTIVGTNRDIVGKILTLGEGRIEGGLVIPVVNFESNNSKRDKDVANILKYKEYPAITLEIVEMKPSDIETVLTGERGEVPMKARLTAAGKGQVYDMVLKFERVNSKELRCSTEVDAKFTDFGLKPPRLGFVFKRAPDAIKLSGEALYVVMEE